MKNVDEILDDYQGVVDIMDEFGIDLEEYESLEYSVEKIVEKDTRKINLINETIDKLIQEPKVSFFTKIKNAWSNFKVFIYRTFGLATRKTQLIASDKEAYENLIYYLQKEGILADKTHDPMANEKILKEINKLIETYESEKNNIEEKLKDLAYKNTLSKLYECKKAFEELELKFEKLYTEDQHEKDTTKETQHEKENQNNFNLEKDTTKEDQHEKEVNETKTE